MVPDKEMSVKLKSSMEISPSMVKNCNQIDAIDAPEEKIAVTCASNYQDNKTLDMEISRPGDCDYVTACEVSNEDDEVNVVEDCDPIEERRVIERDLQDTTESSSSSSSSSSNSSSFGCTDSETDNAAIMGDEEVESLIREDNASLLGFDGFNSVFGTRKKKVSDRWREFVRPIMWRCRWVELCVRELNSTATKYEKEIAENYKRKQKEWEKYASEDLCMRSTPFETQNRQQLVKRRKRKRVEETVDIASYTSTHNLFSYYANRKPFAGSSSMVHDRRNNDPLETDSCDDAFGVNDELPAFHFNKNDAFEIILRKIEEAQSQLRQLSVRMDKVLAENAEKFTSDIANLTAGKGLVVPESTIHNTGEGKCENMEKNGLVETRNQPVKQELNDTTEEEVGIQRSIGKPVPGSKGKAIQHPNSPGKTMVTREQQNVKGRSVFKPATPRKRKRGRRKPRVGRWSRRSSGSG